MEDTILGLLIGVVLAQLTMLFFEKEVTKFVDNCVRIVRKTLGLKGV